MPRARGSSDHEGLDEPPSERDLRAEWLRVRSTRRIFVTLHEARVDLDPLMRLLLSPLIGEARQRVEAMPLPYERFLELGRVLGEPLVCDVVRSLFPEPPQLRISGHLFNRARSPFDRAPRTEPNARDHSDRDFD